MLEARLEQLIQKASESHAAELESARALYFQHFGEPFLDEPDYESRLRNFVEWFVFDHVLAEGLTPYESMMSGGFSGPAEKAEFLPFRDMVHSLFLVRKTQPGRLFLRELFSERDYQVELEGTVGYDTGSVVEERIVPVEGRWYPTNTHLYHEPACAKFVVEQARKLRREKQLDAWRPFVGRVAKLQMKAQRYRHVDRTKIYKELLATSTAAERN